MSSERDILLDERGKLEILVQLDAELKIFQVRVLHQLARPFRGHSNLVSSKAIFQISSPMASFEDYDEFGNYIGADLDSDDDEEELPQNQFLQQPPPQSSRLEGYDDEPMAEPGADEGVLMEIDGSYPTTSQAFVSHLAALSLLNRAFTQGCYPSRRQAVLSVSRRCLWPRCRNYGTGGGRSATLGAYYCSHQGQEMGSRGERYAGNAV